MQYDRVRERRHSTPQAARHTLLCARCALRATFQRSISNVLLRSQCAQAVHHRRSSCLAASRRSVVHACDQVDPSRSVDSMNGLQLAVVSMLLALSVSCTSGTCVGNSCPEQHASASAAGLLGATASGCDSKTYSIPSRGVTVVSVTR